MGLKYVGKNPVSDSNVVPKVYGDTTAGPLLVDADYVAAQIAAQVTANGLQTKTYVDNQDGLRAQKTEVNAADTAYLAASTLNAAGGVAGLDDSGNLLTAQVPAGILTDRVASVVNVVTDGQVFLASNSTHLLTAADNMREYTVATLTVPDPGFPWLPLPFAWIQGSSVAGSAPDTRNLGNDIYGLFVVMPPEGISNRIFAAGIGTASIKTNYYPVVPFGASNQIPASNPAITGSLQLDLYASCYLGSNYTILGAGISYWVLCVPA